MSRIISIWLLLLFMTPLGVHAATINAASAARSDVKAAVDSAVNGDIVMVPSGTVSFDETIYVNKDIRIVSSGGTIIRDAVDRANGVANQGLSSATAEAVFFFDTQSSFTNVWLQGFEFQDDTGHTIPYSSSRGMVQFRGESKSIVITNNTWSYSGGGERSRMIYCYDATFGLIRGNTMLVAGKQAITLDLETWQSDVDGNGSWIAADGWGSTNRWVIEYNHIVADDNGAVLDGFAGARVTFRFNTGANGHLEFHGTESSQEERGGRELEIYGNTWTNTYSASDIFTFVLVRSGAATVYDNDLHVGGLGGGYASYVQLVTYRLTKSYLPFGPADGANAFDDNDTTDGAGTPGGAGDGVFETGTSSAGTGSLTVVDSSKSWTTNQWAGYSVRFVGATGTASSGSGSGLLVDTSKSWTPNAFAGYEIRNLTTGRTRSISTNTATTIEFSGDGLWSFASGDSYEVFKFGYIDENTGDTLDIVQEPTGGGEPTFDSGLSFEIRRVDAPLDMASAGQSTGFTGGKTPSPVSYPSQAISGVYEWDNTGHQSSRISAYPTFEEGTHFFSNTQRPGYTPLSDPHPLIAGGGSGPSAPSSLSVTGTTGNQITIEWTDNASDETGFRVYRSTTSGSGFVLHRTIVSTDTEIFVDTSLPSGTTYYYRVSAYSGSGESAQSNEVNGTTTGSPTSSGPTKRPGRNGVSGFSTGGVIL